MSRSWWMSLLVMALMAVACAPKADDGAEVAGRTAKLYYDALLGGRYEEFVAGIDRHLGQQEDYDRQLAANARQFMARQKEAHQGVASFGVTRVECVDSAHAANVFLQVCYADSTREQIVVPMIEREGVWFMR